MEARREETLQSHTEERVGEKTKSDSKIHTGWGRGEHISLAIQVQERTYGNIYLTNSDEEAIVDFVNDR